MYYRFTENVEDDISQIKNEKLRVFLTDTINGRIPEKFPIPKDFDRFRYVAATTDYLAGRYMLNEEVSDEEIDKHFETMCEISYTRGIYTSFCGWCIVSDDWISKLAELLNGKKCIEIMAGTGLISHALQIHGIDITPYDDFSWYFYERFTTVYEMDAVSCACNLDYDYIICSWPPMNDTTMCSVVKKMYHKHPKAKLIYIGEWKGGCNSCDSFFDMVNIIDKGKEYTYISKAAQYFRSFEGIHDNIYLLEPNNKVKKYKG